MASSRHLLAEWRVANQAAYSAEQSLDEAMMRFKAGQGAEPLREEVDRTEAMRTEANDLFNRALAESGGTLPWNLAEASPSDLFQEWRAADRAAHALEKSLLNESMRAIEHLESVPAAQAHDRAHKLRGIANDLFALAMAEMKARAEAAKR
jgi:hypothetical protein